MKTEAEQTILTMSLNSSLSKFFITDKVDSRKAVGNDCKTAQN